MASCEAGSAPQGSWPYDHRQILRRTSRQEGYAASTVKLNVSIAKRFVTWLWHPNNRIPVVGEEAVTAFLRRCKAKSRLRHVHHIQASLGHLLQMLRDRGELVQTAPPPTIIDLAILKFTSHLRDTCGFAEATCRRHSHYIRRFLEQRFGNGRLHWNQLCRDNVSFVSGYSKQSMPAPLRPPRLRYGATCGIFNFQGICGDELVAAVPTTPHWEAREASSHDDQGPTANTFHRLITDGHGLWAVAH